MNRDPVASSNIASVGYDETSQTMEVEFHSGAVYQYYNVGLELYEQMMQASSKGQFLHAYVKNAYPYSRVG
ncbi:KTSC domain-containing protein [Burkholderia pseudomallei]|uniref:KTSC domain-containing protein n=1 Tax=Burkholderia pseudomallei TaxID=28450 RepID=UPI0008FF0A78|nr:KTSC domain-containing protein [Burkholderia pseudomallei]ARL61649.1 KTSC domain-containing protein [Burkholderia pseudomallei]ARL68084.1 KTSC domain-containing protein [Burkholderia pseudomallei]